MPSKHIRVASELARVTATEVHNTNNLEGEEWGGRGDLHHTEFARVQHLKMNGVERNGLSVQFL